MATVQAIGPRLRVTHRCCPTCGYLAPQRLVDKLVVAISCPHGCKGITTNDFQPVRTPA